MSRYLQILMVFAVMFVACKKDPPAPVVPTIITTAATNISFNTATTGGVITGDGGSPVTESGIYWSKTNNTPGSTDSVKTSSATSGSFTSVLNTIEGSTTYFVRAYAKNSIGTGYGNVITFNTSVDTTKVTFTYNGATVTYGVITSPTTGRKWLDRNVGASRAATSSNDELAYGDLFQWGRPTDGHQLITWTSSTVGTPVNGITTTLATSDVPGHANFILGDVNAAFPDWRNDNNNLRWNTNPRGPCPSGWHVSTKNEMAAEVSNTSTGGTAPSGGITNSNTAYNLLKLTLSGARRGNSSSSNAGQITNQTGRGYFWTSISAVGTFGNSGVALFIDPSTTRISDGFNQDWAMPIRCIKD
ncbi:MAG: FISUMP domain-containing protein [Chitinophagaceae bacterium]